MFGRQIGMRCNKIDGIVLIWMNGLLDGVPSVIFLLTCRGQESAQCFSVESFQEPFGPWTSAPKLMDERAKKCFFFFLRPL